MRLLSYLLRVIVVQSLFVVLPAIWTQTSAPYGLSWYTSTVSKNGQKMSAAIYQGGVYSSYDYGVSWTPSNAPSNTWTSIASNATGQLVIGTAYTRGVYVSFDSGVTYELSLSQNSFWFSTACDCSGSTIIALIYNGAAYISYNGGLSWATVSSLPSSSSTTWYSSFVSCSGQLLAAVVNNGPNAGVYVSKDSGSSWLRNQPSGLSGWTSVAGSSSGQYLVACVYGSKIYTSSDWGVTWSVSDGSVTANWISVTSDSSGRYMAAAVLGGQLYHSVDYGTSWSVMYSAGSGSSVQWRSVSCDGSGEYCVAVAQNQGVYVGNITSLDGSPSPTVAPSQPSFLPTALPIQPTSLPSAAPSAETTHLNAFYKNFILILVGIFTFLSTFGFCCCNCYCCKKIRWYIYHRRGNGEAVTAEVSIVGGAAVEYDMVPISTDVVVLGSEGFGDEYDAEQGLSGTSNIALVEGGVVGTNNRANSGAASVIRVDGEEHVVAQAFRLD